MLSPYRIQGLLLAFTLLFAVAVGWLGVRLFEQDRALARQRRLEQLEAAADRVTSALYHRLEDLGVLLRNGGGARSRTGAVMLHARHGVLQVSPPDGLLYLPVLPAQREAPISLFAESDTLEFQRNDPSAAAIALRKLLLSPDPAVRATALARLGRNLRKAGRPSEALETFRHLSALHKTVVSGLPAELVAAEARCTLLDQLGRRAELIREAQELQNNLLRARWQIRRSTYEFQVAQTRQWLGSVPAPNDLEEKEALSAAASELWPVWQSEESGNGRQIVPGPRPVFAMFSFEGDLFSAMVAPSTILEPALREAAPFSAALTGGDGSELLGRTNPAAKLRVERSPASTRHPWFLQVSSADDGTAGLAGRRWILGSGFALLVALLGLAGFLVARAVSKEMAVARLQADFVAAVSHEFRSPLASISQIAELLDADRWPSPDHRRRGTQILSRESARLRRLVEALLDFARMEAGQACYRLETVPAGEIVQSVVEEFKPSANGHDVQLSSVEHLPLIRADRDALSRAFWNLLENAVKYSPPASPVRVEAETENGWLAVRVRDEGMGIPPSEQPHIFRKFYRGSEAKARGVKGTGIGLAMVRHIVREHGGQIRLESEPGRGSAFTVLLPAERES